MWQYSIIYSVIYEVHLNQLSCSFSCEYIYIGISFFLRTNYKIYIATIYVITLSKILPILSILFYVIRTRSDKVTTFSFICCFHSVQNRYKQFHCTTKGWCASRIIWTPAQVQTILGAHHSLVIIFSKNKGFYVALPIMVQTTWFFFLHYVLLSCNIVVKWQ